MNAGAGAQRFCDALLVRAVIRPRVLIIRLLLCAAGSIWPTVSGIEAADFPVKPITIIVYTKQGGPIDITARQFVKTASKYTDAIFVVQYKTGGGGVLAMEHVLQSRADGHTLFACTKSNIAKMVSTGRERYVRELDWIAMLMTDPECVITRRDSAVAQWDALVRDGRTRTDEQVWGGPSRGGLDHVTAMQIWDRFGLRARWIPYEGGEQALHALLTGQLMAYVGNPADATGQPQLQVSIVSSPARLPHLPNTPTFGELGFPELDQLYMWRGFALRNGCPVEAKMWYANLFEQVTRDPEWQAVWNRDGMVVKLVEEQDFDAIVETNRQEFRRYLKRLDLLPAAQVSTGARWFTQPAARLLSLAFAAHISVALILAYQGVWNRYGDVLILTGLLSICLLLFWETTRFPELEGSRAAAVPRLWMAVVAALSVSAFWTGRSSRAAAGSTGATRIDLVAKLALVLVLHVALTFYAGYYASTALLLISTMVLFGERRPSVLLGITCVWLTVVYLLFTRLMFVPLPTGTWFEALV
jgi:tripartite-type tricarboxylate transporter receptor subunit TctC